MDYILTTNNLTKKYGSKYAADKINIHIKQGDVYGLIGRNGAGKTTILKMLSGLSNPTDGDYSINEKKGKALAGKPDIIVLDEPINGLDPQGIVEVREILGKLSKQRGITIIISSHILDKRKH